VGIHCLFLVKGFARTSIERISKKRFHAFSIFISTGRLEPTSHKKLKVMARFIVIKGVPNSGKTCTMWMIYHMLGHLLQDGNCTHEFKLKNGSWSIFKTPHPIAYFNDKDATDFMAKLIVKDLKIGIISEGDEPIPLENKINEFLSEGMDIIICCVRTRATKYSSLKMFLDKFSGVYKCDWLTLSKGHTKTVSNANQMNTTLKVINLI